jgi:hypothetical protein
MQEGKLYKVTIAITDQGIKTNDMIRNVAACSKKDAGTMGLEIIESLFEKQNGRNFYCEKIEEYPEIYSVFF